MDYVETEADTIDQAIEDALKALGVERDKVTIDVLEEGSRGFLGIGAKKVRIRAAVRRAVVLQNEVDAEEPRLRPQESLSEEKKAVLGEKGKEALRKILHLMGMEATIELKVGDDPEEIVLNIESSHGGLLIGRGGQTLQAMQYLVMRIVGKEEGSGSARIVVDTENYHERHRKKLQDTALHLGESAKRQRRTVSLDNLSAHDRRIIHLTLEDDPWLTTKSLGQGPYRRLLIIPQGDRKNKEPEKGGSNVASREEKSKE
jgi:spoIIIJ-associated protein